MTHHRELVDVDLEEHGVGEPGGHRLDRRLDGAARPAPGSGEVYDHLRKQKDQIKRRLPVRLEDDVVLTNDRYTSLLDWVWDCQLLAHSSAEWTAMTADSPSSAVDCLEKRLPISRLSAVLATMMQTGVRVSTIYIYSAAQIFTLKLGDTIRQCAVSDSLSICTKNSMPTKGGNKWVIMNNMIKHSKVNIE